MKIQFIILIILVFAIVSYADTTTTTTTTLPEFSISLNNPDEANTTSDNTPNFNFSVSGNQDTYSCELFLNDSGYGLSDMSCFQGTFNESQTGDGSCGLNYEGNITNTSGWNNLEHIFDGDASTYATGSITGDYAYVNISSPALASNSSLLRYVRTTNYTETLEQCMGQTPKQFRFYSNTADAGNYGFYCWNGTAWYTLDSGVTSRISEVSWNWSVANGNTTNNTATIITTNTTLADGTYFWNVNCSSGDIVNTSEKRSITIQIPTTTTTTTTTTSTTTTTLSPIITIDLLSPNNGVNITQNTTEYFSVNITGSYLAAYNYTIRIYDINLTLKATCGTSGIGNNTPDICGFILSSGNGYGIGNYSWNVLATNDANPTEISYSENRTFELTINNTPIEPITINLTGPNDGISIIQNTTEYFNSTATGPYASGYNVSVSIYDENNTFKGSCGTSGLANNTPNTCGFILSSGNGYSLGNYTWLFSAKNDASPSLTYYSENRTFELISEICLMEGNYAGCSEVTLIEVVDAINLWSANGMDLFRLVDLINSWADPIQFVLT